MPTFNFTLPTGKVLAATQYTEAQANQYYGTTHVNSFNDRIGTNQGAVDNKTYGGVAVTFHKFANDSGYDLKKEAVKTALEAIQPFHGQFALPDNRLGVWCYGTDHAIPGNIHA